MISDKFDKFTQINKFSRVDNEHILDLFIGIDDKGRKAMELREKFEYKKVLSSSAIEVNQYRKDEYNTLRFSLINSETSGLFYKFCEDLIEHTRPIKVKSCGYQSIVNRYYQWKSFFNTRGSKLLSESEIMGLIGEILFFKDYLALKVGISNALASWSGQELTHKDFSFENTWYEVKTISSGKTEVKISSLEQLESENDGELVVISLEKMSESYSGITLNDLIVKTANMFEDQSERESFLGKTAAQGYAYNDYYDSFVYEKNSINRYLVSRDFPVLIRDDVPKEIVKVSYTLDLALIKKHLINDNELRGELYEFTRVRI